MAVAKPVSLRISDIVRETTYDDWRKPGYTLCIHMTPVETMHRWDNILSHELRFNFKLTDGSVVDAKIPFSDIVNSPGFYKETFIFNYLASHYGLNYRSNVGSMNLISFGDGKCPYCGCREVIGRITCLMCGGPYK